MAASCGRGKDMQTLRKAFKESSSRVSNFQPRTLQSQMPPQKILSGMNTRVGAARSDRSQGTQEI
jgi:hypothetical protein